MRLILVGFGTVGRAVARIIDSDRDRLVREYGFDPQITTIIDSQGFCRDDEGIDLQRALRVKESLGSVAKYPGKGESRIDPRSFASLRMTCMVPPLVSSTLS